MKDKWEELLREVNTKIDRRCESAGSCGDAVAEQSAYHQGAIEQLEWVAKWIRRILATYP